MTEYTEVEYNGETVRQYPDGALRQANGQLVAQHPLAAATITQETSPSLNKRRWELEHAKQAEFQAEAQRALVTQVARGKSPAVAGGVLVGNLAAELAADGSVKEHGIKNYVGGADWLLKQAGLIKEKETESTVNIDKAVFLTPGTREHVAGLLQSLVASDEDGDV